MLRCLPLGVARAHGLIDTVAEANSFCISKCETTGKCTAGSSRERDIARIKRWFLRRRPLEYTIDNEISNERNRRWKWGWLEPDWISRAKIFTPFISKLGWRRRRRRCQDGRSTPKRMEVWCAQIKFAFQVDVPGVYRVPDSTRAHKRALTQVPSIYTHGRIIDTHLCRHVRFCRYLNGRWTTHREVLQTPKLSFVLPVSLSPFAFYKANSRWSLLVSLFLSLSFFLPTFSARAPAISTAFSTTRSPFLPVHILHFDLPFFSFALGAFAAYFDSLK